MDGTPQTLTCSKCGETKPEGDFYRSKARPTGRQAWCKTCSLNDVVTRYRLKRLHAKIEGEGRGGGRYFRPVPLVSDTAMQRLAAELALFKPRVIPCHDCQEGVTANVRIDRRDIKVFCGDCLRRRVDAQVALRKGRQ